MTNVMKLLSAVLMIGMISTTAYAMDNTSMNANAKEPEEAMNKQVIAVAYDEPADVQPVIIGDTVTGDDETDAGNAQDDTQNNVQNNTQSDIVPFDEGADIDYPSFEKPVDDDRAIAGTHEVTELVDTEWYLN